MKKLVLLLLMLLSTPTWATTVWVSPNGLGNGSEASPTNLQTANAAVLPGTIVRMTPGTYPVAPNPSSAGTSGGGPVIYVGMGTRDQIIVPNMVLTTTRNYVHYQNFTVAGTPNGGLRLSGDFDHMLLEDIDVVGDVIITGMTNSLMQRVNQVPPASGGAMRYAYVQFANGACPYGTGNSFAGSTVRDCNFFARAEGSTLYCGPTSANPVFTMWMKADIVMTDFQMVNTNIKVVFAPGFDGQYRGPYFGGIDDIKFKNVNFAVIDSSGACDEGSGCIALRIRDVFKNVKFEGGSITLKDINAKALLSSQGDQVSRDDQMGNKYSGVTFKVDNSSGFDWSWGENADTLQFCSVLTNDTQAEQGAMIFRSVDAGGVVLDHNNFLSFVDPSSDCCGGQNSFTGALRFDPGGISGPIKITNNIFYRPFTNEVFNSNAAFIKLLSGGTIDVDYNLYAYLVGPQNSLLYEYDAIGPKLSAPGSSGDFFADTGEGEHDLFGDPLFLDASFATYNPHIPPNSPAWLTASDGTHIGAFSLGAPTSVDNPPVRPGKLKKFTGTFDVMGRRIHGKPERNGVVIIDGKKKVVVK